MWKQIPQTEELRLVWATDRQTSARERVPPHLQSESYIWLSSHNADAHARFLLTDRPAMKSSTPVLWLDKDHAFYQLHDVVSKHGWHKEHYEQRPDHTVISQQSLTNSHRHKRGTHTLSCFAGIRLIDLSAWLGWCCFNFRPSSCWTGNAKALPVVKHILADLRTVCVWRWCTVAKHPNRSSWLLVWRLPHRPAALY